MLLTTLGEGLGKNPQDTADAIKAFQPALEQTQQLASVLSDQNQLLSRLVQNAQPVASAVATQRGQSLDHLIGSVTDTLQVTSANRQQVQDTLVRLPGTLRSAQTTLAHIAGLAPPTTRTLKNLRPITNDLKDVSKELRDFADSADPTLSELRPVLHKGTELLRELRPVIADLNDGGGDGLKGVTRSYRQLADGALSTRLVDLMEFMKGWSLSTSDYDAAGHYFKAMLPYTPKTAAQNFGGGQIPGAPQNPVPDLPLPRGGRLPVPGGGAEGAPNENGPYLPQLPHGHNDVTDGGDNAKSSDGATGLSSDQENSMMDQLMGGK
jgi:phospholipid/cholesterol/gamma-HCH transport system substrate-binding protein